MTEKMEEIYFKEWDTYSIVEKILLGTVWKTDIDEKTKINQFFHNDKRTIALFLLKEKEFLKNHYIEVLTFFLFVYSVIKKYRKVSDDFVPEKYLAKKLMIDIENGVFDKINLEELCQLEK